MIELENIAKAQGFNFRLDVPKLNVEKGKAYALVGPNGAGKTTLVKIILNLIHADSGSVLLAGVSVNDARSRKKLAFLPEKFNFFNYYTVENTLKFFAEMKNIENINSEMENVSHIFGLTNLYKSKLSQISKGQMQRVGLATLIMGNPEIIILDEPFSGLDPIGIKELRDEIKKWKGQGVTLFINSHVLSEMEELADDVGILNNGKLLYSGKMSELKDKHPDQKLEDIFYQMIKGENND